MRWLCLLLCGLALSGAGWGAPQRVQIGKIWFYTNYDQALELARNEGRPLWLHFGENPG